MRQEKATVQIIYSNNIENANLLSRIIEGQGIRVVDISYKSDLKTCYVIEDNDHSLKTADILTTSLSCRKKKAKTNPYDIILELGDKEKEWSYK